MNFLGHFILAGNNEPSIIGNFIADFVKGKNYQNYPDDIAKGILMHREIDHFTDNHPSFKESKRRIVDHQGHFSGVVIDMFYDHFLAVDFEKYSETKLSDFALNIYRTIDRNIHHLPDPCRFLFGYMKRDNWLVRYRELEGIGRTLNGMSKRVKFDNNMNNAIFDLEENYQPMKNDFHLFFQEIRNYFH